MRPTWQITTTTLAVLILGIYISPAPAAEHREIVSYRLEIAKTMHFDNQATATQYQSAFEQLGVQTRVDGHGGHIDLTYQCPQWQSAQFADHATAHKWQDWLQSLGFEVRHRH